MKKLFILFILSSLFVPIGCMEEEMKEDSPSITRFTNDEQKMTLASDRVNVPTLYDCCTSAITHKLTQPESIKQFVENPEYTKPLENLPAELINEIAQKVIQQHSISLDLMKALFPKKPTKKLRNHKDSVNAVAFSTNNKLLASASDDHTVYLYDISNPKNPQKIKQLHDHDNSVNAVAFSPDNKLLASASWDNIVCLYNISNPKNPRLITQLHDHSGIFGNVLIAFSPDNQRLASGSDDNIVCLYDISDHENPRLIKQLRDHLSTVYSIAFSPDKQLLASGSDDNIVCFYNISDHENPRLITQLHDRELSIYSVAFSANSKLLASGSSDEKVYLYNISDHENPRLITKLHDHLSTVYSMAFSYDNQLFASGSWDKTICLYDISDHKNPRLIKQLDDHSGLVTTIAFNTNNKLFSSGSDDKTVYLYDIENYTSSVNLIEKNSSIEQALFLIACKNHSLDLKNNRHLYGYFCSLPESIQKVLVQCKAVQVPITDTCAQQAPTITKKLAIIACASVLGNIIYKSLTKSNKEALNGRLSLPYFKF